MRRNALNCFVHTLALAFVYWIVLTFQGSAIVVVVVADRNTTLRQRRLISIAGDVFN